MKITLSSILFLCCMITLHAQINDSQTGFKIDPIDSLKQADLKISFKLSPIKGLTNKDVRYTLNFNPVQTNNNKPKGVDMSARSSLTNKKWEVKQRFNEDFKDTSKFAKDYYLGDLKTSEKTVILRCRDHEYVDGDRVKILVNGAIVHPNLTLSGNFYIVDIDLKEGLNEINFVALNEGTSSPNTAQLQVLDPNGFILSSNRWLITTGFKATLIINRQ